MKVSVCRHLRKGKLVRNHIREVYHDYHKNVNMSLGDLKKWKQDPAHKEASLSEEPINRNIVLLSKGVDEWTEKDAKNALRTIGFNKRMRAVKAGKPVIDGLSKRTISLKNWAWDPNKKVIKSFISGRQEIGYGEHFYNYDEDPEEVRLRRKRKSHPSDMDWWASVNSDGGFVRGNDG